MVLVDTSVWVSHLREGDRRLEALLLNAEVMVHGFVMGELACGRMKNRKEILSLLSALPRARLVTEEEFLPFVERHELDGKGIGFVDAHLLASARLEGIPLWTLDRQLDRAAVRLKLAYR